MRELLADALLTVATAVSRRVRRDGGMAWAKREVTRLLKALDRQILSF